MRSTRGLSSTTNRSLSVQIGFLAGGHSVPAGKIISGHGQVHPAGHPFTITRPPTPTATTTAATTSSSP